MFLSSEERKILKHRISVIQSAKERRARRMWTIDIFGEKLYLGGNSLPENQQVRSGYPTAHLPDDDEFTFGRKNLAKKRAA